MLSDIDAIKDKGSTEGKKRKFEVGEAASKIARALGELPILCTYAYNLQYCCTATVGPALINTELLSVNFT